jgi:hypothetical protein
VALFLLTLYFNWWDLYWLFPHLPEEILEDFHEGQCCGHEFALFYLQKACRRYRWVQGRIGK